MGSSNRRRIWRRLAVLTAAAREKVGRRQGLRERAAVWDVIRPALAAAEIDPAPLKNLWPVATAADELRRLGDSPELRRADAAFIAQDPVLASRRPYCAGVTARVPGLRGCPPPGPGAALIDCYAWALAQSGTG
jgi:hypothetical protein